MYALFWLLSCMYAYTNAFMYVLMYMQTCHFQKRSRSVSRRNLCCVVTYMTLSLTRGTNYPKLRASEVPALRLIRRRCADDRVETRSRSYLKTLGGCQWFSWYQADRFLIIELEIASVMYRVSNNINQSVHPFMTRLLPRPIGGVQSQPDRWREKRVKATKLLLINIEMIVYT